MTRQANPRVLALVTVFALAAAITSLSLAREGPEKVTLVGEVVDITTWIMQGESGEAAALAGRFRADQGFPVGIVDDTSGQIYLAVYRNPAPASALTTANEVLRPFMGKKVTVQGTVYRASGVNLIQIALVGEY